MLQELTALCVKNLISFKLEVSTGGTVVTIIANRGDPKAQQKFEEAIALVTTPATR